MHRKMDQMITCIEQLCYVNGDETKHLFASLFDNHNNGPHGSPRNLAGSDSLNILSRNNSRSHSMDHFLFDSFYDDAVSNSSQ